MHFLSCYCIPYAPTDAVSHWLYGDKAASHYEGDRRNSALTLGVGTAAAAVACFVDYQLTPDRLKPGYEKHLSRPSLAVVYGVFGVGLALGAMLSRRT